MVSLKEKKRKKLLLLRLGMSYSPPPHTHPLFSARAPLAWFTSWRRRWRRSTCTRDTTTWPNGSTLRSARPTRWIYIKQSHPKNDWGGPARARENAICRLFWKEPRDTTTWPNASTLRFARPTRWIYIKQSHPKNDWGGPARARENAIYRLFWKEPRDTTTWPNASTLRSARPTRWKLIKMVY